MVSPNRIFYIFAAPFNNTTMTTFEIIISIISLVATIGVFSFLYKIGKKIGGFEESLKNIGASMDGLPCEKRKSQLEDIHADVVAIKTFLTTKYKNTEAIWGMKHSPTVLNENGQKLLSEISGNSFLEKNKDFFIKELEEKNPKTPLDVETYANDVLLENTDNEIFNGIKNWIYNSPALTIKEGDSTREYTVTLYDVCYVLSIPLRDLYLDLHPELIPAKIDQ